MKFPDCPLSPGAKVWGYLRDSGGDGQDLSSQRSYLLEYCKHYGLVMAGLFEDAAISGRTVANRDQFQEMIDTARSGKKPKVEAILYWDLKRFSRNFNEAMFYMSDLELRGYQLISLSDDIPLGPAAPLIRSALVWKGAMDLKDISKDVKRTLRHLVEMKDASGQYLGLWPTRVPVCFTTVPHDTGETRNDGTRRIIPRLVPDDKTWSIGQKAFRMRTDGYTYREIQEETGLYPPELLTRQCDMGVYWARFFKNPIYYGTARYGGVEYPNFVEAMVSKSLWDAAGRRSIAAGPRSGTGCGLVTSLLKCGHCGRPMTTSWATRERRYYACSGKRWYDWQSCEAKYARLEEVDNEVLGHVKAIYLQPDYITALIERVNQLWASKPGLDQQVETEEQKIRELTGRINNLVSLAQVGGEALEEYKLLLARRDAIREGVERLEIAKKTHRPIDLSPARITEYTQRILHPLNYGTLQQKKAILRAIIIQVIITDGSIHIDYRLSGDLGVSMEVPDRVFLAV